MWSGDGSYRIPRDGPYAADMDIEHVLEHTGYKDILRLLFTDGELDIDKILCLHILTTHPYKFLELPRRPRNSTSFLAQDQSPLEKLIEDSRTRKAMNSKSTSHPQPTYVLNLNEKASTETVDSSLKSCSSECSSILDQLQSRLAVNDNITQLVQAVLEALQKSNPQKLSRLMEVAQQPNNVKHIMKKPELQEFLISLSDNKIISSTRSYVISNSHSPSVMLNIENPTKTLQKLIKAIRLSVLKDSNKASEKIKTTTLKDSWYLKQNIKKIPKRKIDVLKVISFISDKTSTKTNTDDSTSNETEDQLSSISEFNIDTFAVNKRYTEKLSKKLMKPKGNTTNSPRVRQNKVLNKRQVDFKNAINSATDNVSPMKNFDRIMDDILTGRLSYNEREVSDDETSRESMSAAACCVQTPLKTSARVRQFHCSACFQKWKKTTKLHYCSKTRKTPDDGDMFDPSSNFLPMTIEKEREEAFDMKRRFIKESKDWDEKMRIINEKKLLNWKRKMKQNKVNKEKRGKATEFHDTLHDFGLLMIKNTIAIKENNKKIETFLNEPLF